MRFIPIQCIKQDMILATNLHDKNQKLLLKQGSVLKKSCIHDIYQLGLSGIYIEDDLSSNLHINTIISEDLKLKALSCIKNLFIDDYDIGDTKHSVDEIRHVIESIIDDMLNTDNLIYSLYDLKILDEYAYSHSVNVTILSIIIGVSLNYNKNQLYNLGLAAILHDIGYIFISKDILSKKGRLQPYEYDIIKAHSYLGYTYVKNNFPSIPASSYMAILHHHERYNGSGYPFGIKKNKIHSFAKIISIADVYDALISDRPYRKSLIPSDAVEYIMGGANVLFDIDLIKNFTQNISPYPIGTCVGLSNSSIGIVVKNFSDFCTRPRIRLLNKKTRKLTNEYINLKDDMDSTCITITSVISM